MTRIRNETDLQSIPLADRLKELSLGKKFPKAVLNGIDPARRKTVVAHCPVTTRITTCSARKSTVSRQRLSNGPNYTRYLTYLLAKTSEIILPTVGHYGTSCGFPLREWSHE